MSFFNFNIIVAHSYPEYGIGSDNKLPWHISQDLKRFKELTTNKIVIMGRKTWDSLPDSFRPLPNRFNIIITRHIDNYNDTDTTKFTLWKILMKS